MDKKHDKKAPAATGAGQVAQQCKLKMNYSRWVHRSECCCWNIFYDDNLLGSVIGIEPTDVFAIKQVIT